MSVVSTGQITIVDNNDARPITAFITASGGTQQVYTKDESAVSYIPNWTTTANTLTAKVYVGSTSDIAAQLTNRKWSNNLSISIGTGTTLAVNVNLTEATPSKVYYFEGDYTDIITGLTTHVMAQITLTMVRTGTNAVFIQVRGVDVIEQATGTVKNVAVMAADLIRASGVDTSGVTYKFYANYGASHINNTMTTEYGMKTTAAGLAPSATAADIGLNLPVNGAESTFNTLVIHERAVADMGVYKVEAIDSDSNTYQHFFVIYDVSDPYETRMVSTSGDKLQNGVGTTDVYPIVYYGSAKVTNLSGWTFTYTYFDRDGNRAGFIDSSKTAYGAGKDITSNTTTTLLITTALTLAAGGIVKCVSADGTYVDYFEVAASTSTTVTVRAPTTNTWLSYGSTMVASRYAGGKLYAVLPSRVTNGANGNDLSAKITVTGDEIDAKGVIFCESNRP